METLLQMMFQITASSFVNECHIMSFVQYLFITALSKKRDVTLRD